MNPHDKILFHQKPPCTRLIRDRSIISISVFYLAGQLLGTAQLHNLGLLCSTVLSTSMFTAVQSLITEISWKFSTKLCTFRKKHRWSIIRIPFYPAHLISFPFCALCSLIRDRSIIRNPRVQSLFIVHYTYYYRYCGNNYLRNEDLISLLLFWFLFPESIRMILVGWI